MEDLLCDAEAVHADSTSPKKPSAEGTLTRRGDPSLRHFVPAATALALLSLLLFSGSLAGDFVLDDTLLVRDNPLIRDPSRVGELLTSDYWSPHHVSGLYRPLVTVSFGVGVWIFGVEPVGFHAVNVLLHALNAVLVMGVFLRLSRDPWIATGGALLFAVHAVHTEAVANVAGRAELLCATFFLGAMWSYSMSGESRRQSALALLLFGLSLLCKENALTFIAVAVLFDAVHERPRNGRRKGSGLALGMDLRRYAAIGLVAALCFGVRFIALPEGSSLPQPSHLDNPLAGLDAPLRIGNALVVLQRYIGLLLFPLRLSYDYSHAQIPLATSLLDGRVLLAVLLSVAEIAAVVWLRRRSRMAFFGAAFFFVTISVVSNLVVPVGTIMAERLLYLPSVGFCLLIAVALRGAVALLPPSRSRRRAFFAAGIGVLSALHGLRASARSADWLSQERLYLVDLAASPGSARVQSNAGFIFQERGDHERALGHFSRALEIEPRYETAYVNAGVSLAALGQHARAIEVFRRAVELSPWVASLHVKLAAELEAVGEGGEALSHREDAARLAPDDAELQRALARAYEDAGHPDWAQAIYDRGFGGAVVRRRSVD